MVIYIQFRLSFNDTKLYYYQPSEYWTGFRSFNTACMPDYKMSSIQMNLDLGCPVFGSPLYCKATNAND